jgi:hypothetical protein
VGQTVASATIAGPKTVENDDDFLQDIAGRQHGGGVPSVAFGTFGTGPVVTSERGGSGRFRIRVTSGSGAQSANANAFTVTCSRAPRKVFLSSGGATPFFYVSSISGNTFVIGVQAAPVASTAYDLEIIVLF